MSRALRHASLALAVCVTAPVGASAAAPQVGDFRVSLRTGYGLPLGSYARVRDIGGFREADGLRIADDTYGVIPLWVDLGYRLSPRVLVAAYFAYALVLPKQAPSSDPLGGGCPENVDCSATGMRLGLEAEVALPACGPARPWVGLGFGYEWIATELDGELLGLALQASTSHRGPELLHVQGGADFELDRALAAGPYAALSAVRYTSCSAKVGGEAVACDIVDAAWHGWLVLGLRGSFGW